MIAPISGASPYSLNAIYAAAFAQNPAAAEISALRASDANIRSQAQKQLSQAGVGATVSTHITYTVGPDGQLYATGATVSAQKRTQGVPQPGRPLKDQETGTPFNFLVPDRGPKTLSDWLRPKPRLAPADEADLFGSDDFLKEVLESTENLYRSRLAAADLGVRAQEAQHYRAAAGLGSAPDYDLVEGPDGEFYAVGGEVQMRASATVDPAQAAEDAQTMANAALAATDVSAQDVSVARQSLARAASLYAMNDNLIYAQQRAYDMAA